MLSKEKLEFIIPVYNEEGCLDELIRRLILIRANCTEFEVFVTFVNDGSIDQSLPILMERAREYSFLKIINLSRNFGHQLAVTAGIDNSTGDWICVIDGDLQDPPELALEMLTKAKTNNADIIYGQRRRRIGENSFKLVTAKTFYKVLGWLCNIEIPKDTGDFRLVSRKVVLALKSMRERHRFIRGLVPWIGFKSEAFLYDREARYAGKTKYPFRSMVRLAMDAIFSFSKSPLRVASLIGAIIVAFCILGLIIISNLWLFTDRVVPGLLIILLSVGSLSGFQIIMMGLMGEYIGRIYEEVKNRPLYFIDFVVND